MTDRDRIARLEGAYEHVATKCDIAEVKSELKTDIAEVKAELRLLKWMMGMIALGVLYPIAQSLL